MYIVWLNNSNDVGDRYLYIFIFVFVWYIVCNVLDLIISVESDIDDEGAFRISLVEMFEDFYIF